MLQTSDFYQSPDNSNKLQCFQAFKKKERAKHTQEIFEKHKQSLREINQLSNLYLKNLNPAISESEFKQIFEKFGVVKSLKIQKRNEIDRFSVLKSEAWFTAFVSYVNEDSAKKAKLGLNGSTYCAKPGLKLFVDYFESKKQRQLNLKAKQMFLIHLTNKNKKEIAPISNPETNNRTKPLYFRLKRNFPFDLNKEIVDSGKDKEEINIKNRLNFAPGNDFDFVFAKFRKLFEVEIKGETAMRAGKSISDNADFLQLSGLSIENNLFPKEKFDKNSLPFENNTDRRLMRSINKCLLIGNKFDLGNKVKNIIFLIKKFLKYIVRYLENIRFNKYYLIK